MSSDHNVHGWISYTISKEKEPTYIKYLYIYKKEECRERRVQEDENSARNKYNKNTYNNS